MPDRGFRSGHHGIAGGHLFQISGDEHSPSLAPVKQRLRTGEIRCGIGPATSTSTPLTRSQCRFTAQIASEAPRRNRSDPTPVAVRSHRGMSPPLPSVGRIFRVDSTRQSMLVPPEILFDWLRRRVLLRVHRNWGRSFVPVVLHVSQANPYLQVHRGQTLPNPARRRQHRASVSLILDRKSTRLNSSHGYISYAVFCLKKKTNKSAHI